MLDLYTSGGDSRVSGSGRYRGGGHEIYSIDELTQNVQ